MNVHIDQLILDGFTFTEAEQAQLQAALSAELERLLAAGGVSTQLAAGTERVAATPITPMAPAHPAQLGRQIARAVYGGDRS